ncbi:MAG: type IV toxin-antitoxin system AbiEi family antitoxin domain-containing protein [Solirubrobacterales bacterium]|nr:type IV toxin-antitoxin system AbiEi family antitoxin domain-containing protein [Solirubrobacterales bacterium]
MAPAATCWERVSQVATAQHGAISRGQLLAAGLTPKMVKHALASGRLLNLHRGVYAAGHLAETPLQREAAALLASGGVLSGLSVLSAAKAVPPDSRRPVDVAVRTRRPHSRPGIRVHRYGDLTPSQVKIVDGLPMTTLERALLDAADDLTGLDLERAVAEALAAKLTSRTKLRETAASAPGRRGAAELLALADGRRPTAQTKLAAAALALKLIRQAGLPEPETEVTLYEGFTADFFFPRQGVVLEVDSFAWHGLVRQNFNRDRRKDRVFRAHGLEVVRVTADELRDTPLVFIADLTRTLALRAGG